jgi:hypothetical protein
MCYMTITIEGEFSIPFVCTVPITWQCGTGVKRISESENMHSHYNVVKLQYHRNAS